MDPRDLNPYTTDLNPAAGSAYSRQPETDSQLSPVSQGARPSSTEQSVDLATKNKTFANKIKRALPKVKDAKLARRKENMVDEFADQATKQQILLEQLANKKNTEALEKLPKNKNASVRQSIITCMVKNFATETYASEKQKANALIVGKYIDHLQSQEDRKQITNAVGRRKANLAGRIQTEVDKRDETFNETVDNFQRNNTNLENFYKKFPSSYDQANIGNVFHELHHIATEKAAPLGRRKREAPPSNDPAQSSKKFHADSAHSSNPSFLPLAPAPSSHGAAPPPVATPLPPYGQQSYGAAPFAQQLVTDLHRDEHLEADDNASTASHDTAVEMFDTTYSGRRHRDGTVTWDDADQSQSQSPPVAVEQAQAGRPPSPSPGVERREEILRQAGSGSPGRSMQDRSAPRGGRIQ